MELADPDSQVSAPVQPAPQRTRLSTAERQAIIERLIAEKRRNKLPDTVGTVQQSESQPQPQPQPQSQPLTEYDLNSQSDFASSRTSVTERESLEGIDRSSAKRRERKSITIPDSVPLFDRSMKWQKDRENELEKLRLEREKMEIESCSFKPQTSRGSTTTPVAPITERLYQVKKAPADDAAKRREEDELRACTFKPQVNSRPRAPQPVVARYLDTSIKQSPMQHDEEYQFKPRTNSVRRGMPNVQRYLETPAFERLARSTRSGSDMNTSVNSVSTPAPRSRPSSAPHTRPSPAGTEPVSITEFLERQNQREARKRDRLDQLRMQQQQLSPHAPQLCRKSLALASNVGVHFVDRMERFSQSIKQKRQQPTTTEYEPTFRPTITPTAAQRRARTVEELSIGDAQRREALIEAKKARAELNELQEATFQPAINPNVPHHGRLRLDDPDAYMQRIQEERQRQQVRAQHAQLQREREELEACTFKPKVNEAPAYVKRIAKSMQLARGGVRPVPTPTRTWV